MRAEVKSLFSPDTPRGLDNYEPGEPDSFCLRIQAFLGPPGPGTGTSFDCTVCSPRWLTQNFRSLDGWNDESLLGHGLVLLPRWDLPSLTKVVRGICENIDGPDWPTVALRISRWLPWEFEYRCDHDQDERLRPSGAS
jgi:hypothetical protein